MTMRCSTAVRTALVQAIITAAGAGAKMKFYNGSKPGTAGGSPAGTLLATLTFGSVVGTAGSGIIDIDESVSQTNSSHVSGTPTYVIIETSGGTFIADIDIGSGAGNMQFTGTIATGVNITLTAPCTITAGNP